MDRPLRSATGASRNVNRTLLLGAVAAVALFNGSKWSPFYDPIAYMMHLNLRAYQLVSARTLYETATVPIALLTLMLAGVPAALYERARGMQASSLVSLSIWLAATVLLTLPTIRRALGFGVADF
jgi:uncharacterized membrane protein (DUF2068 family)